MTMSDEEKVALELECINAKVRMKEVWGTILTLKKITKSYCQIHDLWERRFKKADRELAMEYRRTICQVSKTKQKDLSAKLSKEELLDIIEELNSDKEN